MALNLLWVVIDTSVWVSAILTPSGPPGRIVRAFREYRLQIVMSHYLFAELAGVLKRPRIKRRVTGRNEASELIVLLRGKARMAVTTGDLRLCRDPKDDLIVETAIASRAGYVISRDEDLTRDLILVEALRDQGIGVMTVARFLELLDAQDP